MDDTIVASIPQSFDGQGVLDSLNTKTTKENYLSGGANLNTVTESGFYRMSNGMVNSPANIGAPCDWSQLIVAHGGGDTIAQIIIDYSNALMYVRAGNPSDVGGNGNWTNWRKFVSTEDFSYSNGTLTITM